MVSHTIICTNATNIVNITHLFMLLYKDLKCFYILFTSLSLLLGENTVVCVVCVFSLEKYFNGGEQQQQQREMENCDWKG